MFSFAVFVSLNKKQEYRFISSFTRLIAAVKSQKNDLDNWILKTGKQLEYKIFKIRFSVLIKFC
jgi:hypothetical protein